MCGGKFVPPARISAYMWLYKAKNSKKRRFRPSHVLLAF